jgi:hypothetical protein
MDPSGLAVPGTGQNIFSEFLESMTGVTYNNGTFSGTFPTTVAGLVDGSVGVQNNKFTLHETSCGVNFDVKNGKVDTNGTLRFDNGTITFDLSNQQLTATETWGGPNGDRSRITVSGNPTGKGGLNVTGNINAADYTGGFLIGPGTTALLNLPDSQWQIINGRLINLILTSGTETISYNAEPAHRYLSIMLDKNNGVTYSFNTKSVTADLAIPDIAQVEFNCVLNRKPGLSSKIYLNQSGAVGLLPNDPTLPGQVWIQGPWPAWAKEKGINQGSILFGLQFEY